MRTRSEEALIPEQPEPLPEMRAADRIRATKPPKRSRATNAWGVFTVWPLELTDRIEQRKTGKREPGR